VTHAASPASVWIGHGLAHVADLERATTFYQDVMGFSVTAYPLTKGFHAVLLTARRGRDRLAFCTWLSKAGPRRISVVYPTLQELAEALRRLIRSSQLIEEGRHHGGSVTVFLRDPEGNRLELSSEETRSERPAARAGAVDGRGVAVGLP
jgi:catechol 2,3-dioxygenase